MNKGLLILTTLLLSVSCGKGPSSETVAEEKGIFDYDVTYIEDESNFCNPERGLYIPNIHYFRNGRMPSTPTTENALKAVRLSGKTLTYSDFYIMDYVDKDFTDEALEFFRNNFEAHRAAGVKTIVRYAYSDGYAEKNHPWDASLQQTLRHVAQLKPIFQEYEDVIYVVQFGFVGSWGEGYYTDNFIMNPRTDADYQPRRELMDALLDAVPANRQIAIRYPLYKRGILGIEVKDSITAKTAFGTSAVARIAGFNDCFVSAGDDVGTYKVGGDREYWATETNYVSMGGETCSAPQAFCNCEKTYENLIRFHWTYLNEAYNKQTHKVWQAGGCYDDIVKRLGYRFVLMGAAFEGDFEAGASLQVKIHFKNIGFASLINARPMQWVIINKDNASEKYIIPSPKDPREWKGSNEYVYEETIKLPALKSGSRYKLALELPDASPRLASMPEFSVRFANEGVWDDSTGLNVLTVFTAK